MLKWFLKLFDTLSVKPIVSIRNPIAPTVQEDPATEAAIKRTRASFRKQERAMNIRALKPHSASCKDPLTCMKTKCFKPSPDKIVKGSESIVETAEQIAQRMSNKKGVFKS